MTYLSTDKLAERLNYSTRHVREYLKDRIFIEGIHYVRAPGGRKLLFVWEQIEEDFFSELAESSRIQLASGGFING